ncbi:hypothetical protein G5576_102509 [Homo sapiens]|uniref:Uncharacterized protein n=1 Tax=Homo sapiens TaxID=9606 RepID=A0A087WV48_HUMAN|nr:hypothetical protein KI723_200034 [Homo sapiens]KAI4004522.1 hypothetical protein G5576_102509 [Homo sapiens]
MGVQVETISPGDGRTFPKRGQTCVVHYTGCGQFWPSCSRISSTFLFQIMETWRDPSIEGNDFHWKEEKGVLRISHVIPVPISRGPKSGPSHSGPGQSLTQDASPASPGNSHFPTTR